MPKNFIGASSTAWRNVLVKYCKALLPEEGEAAEAAFVDLSESSWARTKPEEATGSAKVAANDTAAALHDAIHNG